MHFRVDSIKEHKDGSATLNLSFDKEVEQFVLNYYKKKKVTSALMRRFVLEGIKNYVNRHKRNKNA